MAVSRALPLLLAAAGLLLLLVFLSERAGGPPAGRRGRAPEGGETADGRTSHACRFWALTGAGYPEDLIRQHLRDGAYKNLRALGANNYMGWGFAAFLDGPDFSRLRLPLFRRGRPAANDSFEVEYGLTVDELSDLRPRCAIGHVRLGSTGHFGIPNPHPFQQERWVFAHNGTLPVGLLDSLLVCDDPFYLSEHPPEYVNGFIDSELYFLYILKVLHRAPGDFEAAVCQAVRDIDSQTGGWRRLNFVMSSGDTVWAVRCCFGDEDDPVVFHPCFGPPGQPSPYWVVSSEPLGASSFGWAVVPPRSLSRFVPGQPPHFALIDSVPAPAGVSPPLPAVPTMTEVRTAVLRPNPSSGTVAFELSPGFREAEIVDVMGRRVRRAEISPAARSFLWDGKDQGGRPVPAGVYNVLLSPAGNERQVVQRLVRVPSPPR